MGPLRQGEISFFNSYFMESKSHEKIWHDGQEAFIIRLNNEELIVPLKFYSKLHRHEYTGVYLLKSETGLSEVSFETAVQKVLSFLNADSSLFERVIESSENIRTTLHQRSRDLQNIFNGEPDFISSEQALYAGHLFHPAPKSRQGFTPIDAKLYCPESGSAFPLRWFLIKEELIYQKHSNHFHDHAWLKDLSHFSIPHGFVPFPMHPWQASRILARADIQEYFNRSLISEIQETGSDWSPTSSLRTLYQKDAKYMLKFSLDVKLTNSVRHMLEHELDRGLQVHDILMSPEGQKFMTMNPDFKVAYEPVYIAIKDISGQPIKETFVMARENIIGNENGYYMVAFLTQKNPAGEKNFIQKEICQLGNSHSTNAGIWLTAFLEKAVKPFLVAESEYGILLGAHQQNLIIKLENHLPVAAIFRDCHGTGYSPLGEKLFGHLDGVLKKDNGNILSHETGNYLFSYYLIINTLFNVIAAIADDGFVDTAGLLTLTKKYLKALKETELKNSTCLDYLLNSEALMHKGNFLCSLKSINENTTDNPLSIYIPIENPLYQEHSHV